MENLLQHEPIMTEQILRDLECGPEKNFLDLTLGGGGHAIEILRSSVPKGVLFGMDRDLAAIERCRKRLEEFQDRTHLYHGEMSEFDQRLSPQVMETIAGVLIDCGVSSFQLDTADRGFSFRFEAPLDMRMNQSQELTALDVLSQTPEDELANLIYIYGQERYSRRIAKSIKRSLAIGALQTTTDLADLIYETYPSAARRQKIHPATRSFQAIRMRVNDEMGQIEKTLQKLIQICPQACRIAVLSFHSIEDRLIKTIFRKAKQDRSVRWVHPKVLVPSREECKRNPRARSAKLRVVEVL